MLPEFPRTNIQSSDNRDSTLQANICHRQYQPNVNHAHHITASILIRFMFPTTSHHLSVNTTLTSKNCTGSNFMLWNQQSQRIGSVSCAWNCGSEVLGFESHLSRQPVVNPWLRSPHSPNKAMVTCRLPFKKVSSYQNQII